MHLVKLLTLSTLLAVSTRAIPVSEVSNSERGLIDSIHITDDLLLFDSPAFPNPNNSKETLIDVQSFAFSRIINFGSVIPSEIKIIVKVLAALGVDAAQKIEQLEERVKLFLAIGLPGKSEQITVAGCSTAPDTGVTDLIPNLGMSNTIVSVGQCGPTKKSTGSIGLDVLDDRQIGNTIHFSSNSGFGVISDIDDTIKISNVLDKSKLAKATFIDDPEPVAGMPELFTSLAKSLPDPQFIYITGSPFQLYPFLNDFVKSTFSAATGPIWTRNLTLTNPAEIVDLISGGSKTLDYKLSQIERLRAMYPKKKWLAIGDSTEKDPEVYAEMYAVHFCIPPYDTKCLLTGSSFKRYPGFISCIWIRKVDGAANEQTRFDTAFNGVPKKKTLVFTDKDIPSLSSIRVANGECTKA